MLNCTSFAQTRIYADQQINGNSGLCAGCIVTNPNNAISANFSDFSRLNITLGLVVPPSTYQTLIFSSSNKPTAGTPVIVKLGTGDQLLSAGVLGAITLQAYNNQAPVGNPVYASTLVSALSNNNQVEVAFTPAQDYDRVRVTLNGGLVSGLSNIYLYGTYFNAPGNTACDFAVDEVNGISAGLLGLGASVGGVVNPQQAIDGNLNTASTLNAGVGLTGAYAQQTVIYNNASVLGDSVRLTLSIPQSLLDAGVLSNIQVSTANGTTDNNDSQNISSTLVNVRLLAADANGRKVTVTFAPTAVFDRVQLRLGGGIANVQSALNFYEAQRLIPRPIVSINGILTDRTAVCTGSSVTLSAAAKANTVFRWYNLATGGTLVFEGNTFQTPTLTSTTTYYVEAVRNGCTNASERAAAIITVNPIPDAPVVANSSVSICSGQNASFTTQNLAGVNVNWYTAATGGTAVFTGNTFTTPALTSATTYYAEATSGNCISATRTAVTVNINQAPGNFTVTPSTKNINTGETSTFTAASADANAVFNWYNLATGGTSFFTGAVYTTPALSANATYYAEAVSAEGCAATSRIAVTVTVNQINPNPVPCDAAISQTTDVNALLCIGCTVTNPQNGVDQSSASFSQLNVAAGLGNAYAQQTLRFAGSAGDSVVVDLGLPANLVNVSLLSQIQLATFNGSVYNDNRFSINNTTANIQVLTNQSHIRITFKATKDFDRVEIRLNSTAAGLLSALKIFDAAQEVAAPVFANASVNACAGMQTSLTATAANNVTVNWYDVPTGGIPIYTGTTFTTPALSASTTYYAASTRTTSGCVQTVRTPVTVNVVPQPATPVVNADQVTVCAGQRASFTAQNLAGVTYNWYTTPTGGNAVFTGNNFVSDSLTATTKFYVEAVNGQCTSPTRKEVTANVAATIIDPVVAQTGLQTCSGTAATLTASSPQQNATFNWFDTATATTPVYTGANFTTPALTAKQAYFVQAALGNCTSAKVEVDVTVNPNPDAPTVAINPANGQIAAGQTATLTASSTTPGTTFKYYAQATGGMPLFEGGTLTTPALSSNTTFYVEAVSAAGCVSATRTAVNITVTPVFSTTCDLASTQTNAVDGLCVSCTIINPNNVVDADMSTFARFNIPAGVTGGNITQRLIFADQGIVGDTVQILVHVPNTVLSAQILNGLQLTSYNGTTSNNDQTNASTGLAGLQILGGGDQALLKFAPQAPFTAVELQLNAGATSALITLDVFYATKQISIPQLTQNTTTVCANGNTVFTVANPRADVTYDWFDAASGGNLLFTGAVFTTPNLTASATYYVQATPTSSGCVNPSRVAAVVSVTPTPPVAILAQNNLTVCAGESVNLSVTNASNDNTVKWYDAATGGNLVFTGTSFQTPALQTSIHFYAELNIGNCTSATRTDVVITVNPRPATPQFAASNVTVCANSSAALSISNAENNVSYEWFTSAAGGNAVFTGINFTTPALSQNTTYYLQSKSATGSCVNNGNRAAATVTVTNSINQPVLNSTQNSVCSGGMVTISVVNPSSALTYNWYDAVTGGTIAYTGTSFTIKNITADVSYYVEAGNGAGCISSSRKATAITVIPAPAQPAVQAGGLMACEGNVTTLKINNPQPDQVYNWYNMASGGNTVFTGNEFTTPVLIAGTVYYVEASSSQSCNPSARLAVNVTVNALPSAPGLAAATVTICVGDKATFSVSSPVAGVIYRWFDSPAKTNKLFEGSTFVSNTLTTNTDFYVDAVSASGCTSSAVTVAHAVVSAAPDAPLLTNQSVTVCAGSVATFSVANPQNNLTYKWYSAATGGNAVFTGINFTTPALSQNTVFYAEASRNGSCTSATRTAATVTVSTAPAAPVVSTQGTTICVGSNITLTATADANTTIKWYGQASGGTELYTGTSFVTPVLTASTTYYAAAVSGSNNCTSATRTAVTVTVGAKLTPPFVSVRSVTINSLTFGWNAINGASSYEISLDNGKTFTAAGSGNAALSYTATNLKPAQSVTIIVRAKGASDCQTSANATAVTGTTSNPLGNLVWVPNAFTPNGDGANETVRVYGNTIKTLNFNIYSQWGELLFNSTSVSLGWDGTYKGKLQPVGVYVYYVEAVTNDGETVKLKGTINLLR
ncbi:MAG: gliding motility-associated C-terminal domain-containing protein [Janthinobacterium lividum]